MDYTPINLISINIIGAVAFNYYSEKKDYYLFVLFLNNINKALEVKLFINPIIIFPKEYYNFLNIFSKVDLDILVSH